MFCNSELKRHGSFAQQYECMLLNCALVFVFIFVLATVGFEFRASHLLDRHSNLIHSTSPLCVCGVLGIFKKGSGELFSWAVYAS
jgi:hypothetical protein